MRIFQSLIIPQSTIRKQKVVTFSANLPNVSCPPRPNEKQLKGQRKPRKKEQFFHRDRSIWQKDLNKLLTGLLGQIASKNPLMDKKRLSI